MASGAAKVAAGLMIEAKESSSLGAMEVSDGPLFMRDHERRYGLI